MTRPEVAVLVNAAAGRGRAARAVPAVVAALTAGGVRPRALAARTRAEAERLATVAVGDGVGAVAALGGDGTAHAVLQAVAGTGTPLALLPAGSGNDLATALGVPTDPVRAAADLVADLHAGRTRQLDSARTGERWWATVLCCGFDSAVTERAHRLRWPRGPRRYDVAILLELAQLRPRAVTLTVDGAVRQHEVTLVAVGNTPWYGGGLRIAPGADPADGLLEVVVIGPVSRRELVRTRPRLAAGSHVGHPAVTVLRGREIGLTGAGLTTWADGEPIGALPATTVCVPGALTVLG
ncbi:sphingosine kinase [Modestobacter caceresii]|uniref:Sphingosine kinase n=1 Tax=Modestobacter caceresii TaxID=1522368 RepID=A0A098YDL2_9ACTN|nr:diacylglycerol kinase family protein [Modestobacter caceresii]KGH48579.1 sphingosine kinase [Modestobacter caceresii]